MRRRGLTYAVVTPTHDEERNLPQLAESLLAQKLLPLEWLIVDDGSRDSTLQFARRLVAQHSWIRLLEIPVAKGAVRGGPIVRSFNAGVRAISSAPDVIVKLDADVTLPETYFEQLLEAFDHDERLGIASGSAFERQGGVWTQRFSTGTSVWGASRAYRSTCLAEVSPLAERMGWDAIDEHKAHTLGWRTETFLDIPFFHHRGEGERDSSARSAWRAQGSVSHFLGYRPSYLLFRTGFQACRTPAALYMLVGYVTSALRREARCDDQAVVRRVREQQRLRHLVRRASEALGRSDERSQNRRLSGRARSASERRSG